METEPNALIYNHKTQELIESIIENDQVKIRIPLHGGGEYFIPIPPGSKYTIYPGTPRISNEENRLEAKKPKWMKNTDQKILDDIAEGP